MDVKYIQNNIRCDLGHEVTVRELNGGEFGVHLRIDCLICNSTEIVLKKEVEDALSRNEVKG